MICVNDSNSFQISQFYFPKHNLLVTQALNVLYFGFLEPPSFIQKLEPSKVLKKGESVHFECKVTGTPEIKISWFKNDTEIRDGDKYKIHFDNSIAVLEINDTGVEDSGDYICDAQNDAGSVSCSVALNVKGR